MKKYIEKISKGFNLEKDEMIEAMDKIFSKKINDIQIASFLIALKTKGESIEEILGAAEYLKSKSIKVNAKENGVDLCGTGGDGLNTFNISTLAALIVASCGVSVYKHGNKSVSGKCGSADILDKMGVNIFLNSKEIEKCVDKTNFGFIYAPLFHPILKEIGHIRKQIGVPTIFNILGPLINPANVKIQSIGVYNKNLISKMIEVLKHLGVKRAIVFSSEEGLDEISTFSKTYVSELVNGKIREYILTPSCFGISKQSIKDLECKKIEDYEDSFKNILLKKDLIKSRSPLINAAAALYLTDKVSTYKEGYKLALDALEKDKTKKLLISYIKESGGEINDFRWNLQLYN